MTTHIGTTGINEVTPYLFLFSGGISTLNSKGSRKKIYDDQKLLYFSKGWFISSAGTYNLPIVETAKTQELDIRREDLYQILKTDLANEPIENLYI